MVNTELINPVIQARGSSPLTFLGRTLDNFFYASHIRLKFPYKVIPIIDELVEIFLKLSKKTV